MCQLNPSLRAMTRYLVFLFLLACIYLVSCMKVIPSIKDLALKYRKMQRKVVDHIQPPTIINLYEISTPQIDKPIPWTKRLSRDNERILLKNDWLLILGKNSFKPLFQMSVWSSRSIFGINVGLQCSKNEFIQILHTGKGHRITITTIGCERGYVDVYDSFAPFSD